MHLQKLHPSLLTVAKGIVANNEYHDIDINLVNSLNQAAINGIRAVGATSQDIFVEDDSYTGAWAWVPTRNSLLAGLTDPSNKVA